MDKYEKTITITIEQEVINFLADYATDMVSDYKEEPEEEMWKEASDELFKHVE